jgi:plasmid maintenance system antidote protein VapI
MAAPELDSITAAAVNRLAASAAPLTPEMVLKLAILFGPPRAAATR